MTLFTWLFYSVWLALIDCHLPPSLTTLLIPIRLVIDVIPIRMKDIYERSLTIIHLLIVPTVTVMINIIKVAIRLTWDYLLILIIQFVIIRPVIRVFLLALQRRTVATRSEGSIVIRGFLLT